MSPRRIVYGVTALFLLVGASFALDGTLTYWSFSQGESISPVMPLPPSPAAAPSRPKKDYGVIARRDLFGGNPSIPPPASAARREPPKLLARPPAAPAGAMPVKFRLVGTTVFPGGGGFVILEDRETKMQYVHREGEKVHGTLIQQVSRGTVRLLTGSRVEVLQVFDEKDKDPSGSPTGGLPVSPAGVPSNRTDNEIRPTVRLLPRALFDRTAGPGVDLKMHFRAERYRQPDGEEGIRLFPIASQGIMTILGLQPGDLVLSIQGEPATDPESLIRQLGAIAERPQTEMEILRRGRKLSMAFRIQG